MLFIYLYPQLLSPALLFAAPWTAAHQSPLSMGFSRYEYKWVAISFSRGSSWPRIQTHVSCVSCIGMQIPYHEHQRTSFLTDRIRRAIKMIGGTIGSTKLFFNLYVHMYLSYINIYLQLHKISESRRDRNILQMACQSNFALYRNFPISTLASQKNSLRSTDLLTTIISIFLD